MSDFFQSELVRGTIQEMMELQEFCMRSMMTFPVLPPAKKMDYFEKLELLIEKQKIFYGRLSLSDDPEAKAMAESMRDAAVMLGATPDDSIPEMFNDLLKKVETMKGQLESGTDG